MYKTHITIQHIKVGHVPTVEKKHQPAVKTPACSLVSSPATVIKHPEKGAVWLIGGGTGHHDASHSGKVLPLRLI